MLRRVILPEAEEELRAALAWYESRGPGLGAAMLSAVEAAMDQAASLPLHSPAWALDARYRRVVVRRFPYLVFYELRDDAIEFVAVAHVRREPGYWLGRTQASGADGPEEGGAA